MQDDVVGDVLQGGVTAGDHRVVGGDEQHAFLAGQDRADRDVRLARRQAAREGVDVAPAQLEQA